MKKINLHGHTCATLELVKLSLELAFCSNCRIVELDIEISNVGNWAGSAIHIIGFRGFMHAGLQGSGGRHKSDLFSAEMEFANFGKGWFVRQFTLCCRAQRFDTQCEYSYCLSAGQANFPSHIALCRHPLEDGSKPQWSVMNTDDREITILPLGEDYFNHRDFAHTPSLGCVECGFAGPAYMFTKIAKPEMSWKCSCPFES